MSGLILLFALGICFWLGGTLVRWVGQVVPNPKWKGPAKTTVALALIASPFVDEVIGMYQFNALCKANGIESADVSKAKGRRILLELSSLKQLKGLIMPGEVQILYYKDEKSGQILFEHKNYYALGGWVMRFTPLSMGSHHPMLFSGSCFSDYVLRDAIFSKNGIFLSN